MASPTFNRSRSSVRRARLRRTILLAVLAAGLAAFAIGRLGGDEPEIPIAKVAFQTSIRGEGAPKPEKGRPAAEAEAIEQLLNDYYQRAFVDPESFADGSFPEVEARFTTEAKSGFTRDLNTLTIGEAATEVTRVDPTRTTARIIVYFEGGEPRLATAAVRFVARATMKDRNADPLSIDHRATFHFQREGDDWKISYYSDASHEQVTVTPKPTTSP